ncbi:hypothetical protein QQ045_008733 [Rhodiola kirilowii]
MTGGGSFNGGFVQAPTGRFGNIAFFTAFGGLFPLLFNIQSQNPTKALLTKLRVSAILEQLVINPTQLDKTMLSSSSYVLILIIILAADSTAAAEQRFKEAPKFYNAEHCHVGKSEPVHIAMTLDANYLRGSIAAVFSILQHASCPENIHLNFITATNGGCDVRGIVSTTFPYLSFETYTIDLDSIASFVSNSIRSALDSPLNYARIYLAKILPTTISKVVYLDSDLILVDDIAHLAATEFQNNVVLAAPEYCNANFTSYFTPSFWANPSLSLTFSARKACYFNTGVMVIDLRKWRSGDYTRRMEDSAYEFIIRHDLIIIRNAENPATCAFIISIGSGSCRRRYLGRMPSSQSDPDVVVAVISDDAPSSSQPQSTPHHKAHSMLLSALSRTTNRGNGVVFVGGIHG